MFSLKGILLPTTTPFDSDGRISATDITSNIKEWSARGVIGFVVLGSTGERVHLDEREYLEVIEVSRAATDSTLIVGAGQQSTVNTIKEIKNAARAGAEAVLVITPYFYRPAITQETLVNYYTAVADAAPVPVLLYSMPPLTGIKIEPETVARLSEHPNIIGVKDSSNDVAGFRRTVELCPRDFAVITGNGTVLLDAVGCVVPEVCVEIFRSFAAGEDAEKLQEELTPLASAVTTKYGIGGLKAALDFAGYRGGAVRAPLRAPDEAARAEIKSVLDRITGFA
jgi:dihydrodipicolinate synthase/N-acetylneuraminate lyase